MQSTRNKLIQLLANHDDQYISGQMLSEKLNISRSAIWKHMKALEDEGFIIEGKSKLGYRIIKYPDRLNEYALKRGLDTTWLGNTIIFKEQMPSTQTLAHELAQNQAEHGTVIIASEQTAGKGRMNRTWHSPKEKGMWLSMILRPTIFPYLAPQLTLLTATVLAQVIIEQTPLHPKIKWPNDILIHDKKVAGILTEMKAEQDQIEYVVIGIGLNVNQEPSELPDDLKQRATSLYIESGNTYSIKSLIQEVLKAFEREYIAYMDQGFSNVKQKWEQYGYKIGQSIWMTTGQRRWQGTFLGIAEDGALLVRTAEQQDKKIYSAEIEWF